MPKKTSSSPSPSPASGARPLKSKPAKTPAPKRAARPATTKGGAGGRLAAIASPSPVPAAKGRSPRAATGKAASSSASKPASARRVPVAPIPNREEIARRAYFIAERRRAEGLPGGPAEDWYAAERELARESGSRKPKSARRG